MLAGGFILLFLGWLLGNTGIKTIAIFFLFGGVVSLLYRTWYKALKQEFKDVKEEIEKNTREGPEPGIDWRI